MKKHLCGALFLVILCSCTGNQPGREHAVQWRVDSLVRVEDSTLLIHLVYPLMEGTGVVADSVNSSVRQTLQSLLNGGDAPLGSTLAASVDSMLSAKDADSLLRERPYSFLSDGTLYQYGNVISVWLQQYAYTGGAHGMMPSVFLNFDATNGKRLTTAQLFRDTTSLAALNRNAFLSFAETKADPQLFKALFVAPEQLPLPQHIGFDSVGVVMVYNQYEIAPYAFGLSVYSLPYPEIQEQFSDIVTRK